jgi:hypothetical protein
MIEIELNGIAKKLPQSWAEAERKLIPKLIEQLFTKPESGETYHEILRLVLGYSDSDWKRMMRRYFSKKNTELQKQKSSEALQELLRLVSWMWKLPLTTQPVVSFFVGKDEYLLPNEDFLTVSWGELKDAYVHCEVFSRQLIKGEKHLNLLVMTLCRPKRKDDYMNSEWDGDLREPYNEYISGERANNIESLDFNLKLSVLLYFVGTIKKLLNQYDIFYSEEGNGAKEDFPGQGFEENTLLLSEKNIFGNYKETIRTNCHNIFLALERNKKLVEAEIELRRKQNL